MKKILRTLIVFIYKLKYILLGIVYEKILLGECGKRLRIYGNVNIKNAHNIFVGRNVSINDGVYLNGLIGGIEIGNNTAISAGSIIVSTGLNKEDLLEKSLLRHNGKKIKIGNNCQIGAGAIILSGVEIGDNVIIGAGTVVTKNIPSFSIAFGNPLEIRK